jgi:hypothetical protein
MNSLRLSKQFGGIVLCNEEMVDYCGDSISISTDEGHVLYFRPFCDFLVFWPKISDTFFDSDFVEQFRQSL